MDANKCILKRNMIRYLSCCWQTCTFRIRWICDNTWPSLGLHVIKGTVHLNTFSNDIVGNLWYLVIVLLSQWPGIITSWVCCYRGSGPGRYELTLFSLNIDIIPGMHGFHLENVSDRRCYFEFFPDRLTYSFLYSMYLFLFLIAFANFILISSYYVTLVWNALLPKKI